MRPLLLLRFVRRAAIPAAAALLLGAAPALGGQAQIGGDGSALRTSPATGISLLGISTATLNAVESAAHGLDPDQRGAIVARVAPASAGARAGLRAGDVVIAINGAPLVEGSDLRARVAELMPVVELELTVLRHGNEETIDVSLVSPAR